MQSSQNKLQEATKQNEVLVLQEAEHEKGKIQEDARLLIEELVKERKKN